MADRAPHHNAGGPRGSLHWRVVRCSPMLAPACRMEPPHASIIHPWPPVGPSPFHVKPICNNCLELSAPRPPVGLGRTTGSATCCYTAAACRLYLSEHVPTGRMTQPDAATCLRSLRHRAARTATRPSWSYKGFASNLAGTMGWAEVPQPPHGQLQHTATVRFECLISNTSCQRKRHKSIPTTIREQCHAMAAQSITTRSGPWGP